MNLKREKMKKNLIVISFLLLLIACAGFLVVACSDSKQEELEEPASADDDDDGDQCNISEEGLSPIPNAYIECGDLENASDYLSVSGVFGTSNRVAEGERFKISGSFDFSNTGAANFEPIAGCPLGSSYQKCSYHMEPGKLIGEFKLMLNIADCAELSSDTEISINVSITSTTFLYKNFCVIHLDGPPPGDDDDDDDDDDDTI